MGQANLKPMLFPTILEEATRGFEDVQSATEDVETRAYKKRWAAVHLADIIQVSVQSNQSVEFYFSQANYRIALTMSSDRGQMIELIVKHLIDPHSEVRNIALASLTNSSISH